MAILKCKMCGGELNVQDGMTIVECEYCGSKQTLPKLVSENIANLYDRANHFRRNNEFDKAEGIYERILAETPEDSEAYWSLVLCRYGIEYVEDPTSGKRVPTVNRAQYTSIFDDENYKSAIEHADTIQRRVYEEEAAAINDIQKEILAISQKEEPFDVFICYKETDQNGRRTRDSVIATDLYHQLIKEGFKVFFSRITLEDKLGTAYEPYIFAALNSAKVMVVLGTKPEFFNAVWVKNEWSRYLALVKQSGGKKVLIPAYRDMDPYDLPEEFSHLQAQDMSKLGFMQDLIRGIKKITASDKPKPQSQTVVVNASAEDIAPLLKRMFIYLEDGEFDKANEYAERVLDKDPENGEAYLGNLMVDLKVLRREDLKNQSQPFDNNRNYQKAVRFGSEKLQSELKGYIKSINDRIAEEKRRLEEERRRQEEERRRQKEEQRKLKEQRKEDERRREEERRQRIYNEAAEIMNSASTEDDYQKASRIFYSVSGYRDADDLTVKCREKAEDCRKDSILKEAKAEMKKDTLDGYYLAKSKLKPISGYNDADELLSDCEKRISEISAVVEKKRKKEKKKRLTILLSAALSVTAVVVAFVILLNTVIIPNGIIGEAKKLADNKNYIDAINKLNELSDNKEAEKLKKEYIIPSAKELANKGKYTEAIYRLNELSDNKEAEKLKEEYCIIEAKRFAEKKNYSAAASILMAAGINDQTKEMYFDWSGETLIAAGKNHTVGIKADGTVVAKGNNSETQCDVEGWNNIVAVAAGGWHTVGLKADGTVVATGENKYNQCDVAGWNSIIAISSRGSHTVGLKENGTVIATGKNDDGRCDVSDWKNIVAVAAGTYHTVGLKADGTVVATGNNDSKQCDVAGWSDIIAVSAGYSYTVGLKADGTVVATGSNNTNQCDVEDWSDIIVVEAGYDHTVGLKADGTVVATGNNSNNQCKVEDWSDIVEFAAGGFHTVGLKADGTVVATGDNNLGQCDVSDWKLW